MAEHQISNAETLLRGDNYYAPYAAAHESRRGIVMSRLYFHDFGAVATLDADGIAQAQAVAGAGNLTLNGALASGGVVTFDVPRAVSATSSDAGDTTQTMTFTGTDYYGQAQTETIALNGAATVAGTKAFKTITQVAVSALLTGNGSAGSLDVLGLPFRIDNKSQVIQSRMDGADDAVTIVVADTTTATATTDDVRGTVDFSTASNGTRRFAVLLSLPETAGKEALFGVTPA